MENFRIDFTLSNPFPDGKKLGEIGEKKAACLIITPPENLASREEIRSYVVAFSTQRGPVRYGPFPKTEAVTLPVDKKLTVGTALSVQLEGYDEDGEFIIKSPVLSGIEISGSVGDCPVDGNDKEDSFVPGHIHENLDLLDELSDENGVLKYKGNAVSDGVNIITAELKHSQEEFFTIVDSPFAQCISIISCNDKNGNSFIPVGAKIHGIEISTDSDASPEWIDIYDLNSGSRIAPYTVNMNRAFYSGTVGNVVLAILFFPQELNDYADAFMNYSVNAIRVRYTPESGDKK